MDVSDLRISLHPQAKDALFRDYQTLRYLFSNVLGQVETDYLSIAFIDEKDQLAFFSSHPSIEQNLIEKNLWQHDGAFNPYFIEKDKLTSWSDLYQPDHAKQLYRYKQADHGFVFGISIPSEIDEFRAVFSFGFKSANSMTQQHILHQKEKLLAMGKYCFREIMQAIPFPFKRKTHESKPHLKLIINNQVNYENPITER